MERLVIFFMAFPLMSLRLAFFADLLIAKTRSGLPVLRPRRTEDIEHARALRPGAHGVRHISRRAPEITLFHLNLLAALKPDRRALKQYTPLLLGMMMQGPFRVWRQRYHRQHRLLAGKNARGEPRREIAKQAVLRIIQVVKLALLTHRSSPVSGHSTHFLRPAIARRLRGLQPMVFRPMRQTIVAGVTSRSILATLC